MYTVPPPGVLEILLLCTWPLRALVTDVVLNTVTVAIAMVMLVTLTNVILRSLFVFCFRY